ncbi:hypothetical protein DPMN_136728 [Dreissena polymorpha]|uniref:Uncharacterized protein n=1 Tax=Dreissena polymorpha TaxID=45954 RepID=A0A9D4G0F4_DREPO|nr:hypothetical protein DPMN_136728 [Dreissena polymorpha]
MGIDCFQITACLVSFCKAYAPFLYQLFVSPGLLSTIARAVIGLIADRKWFSRARLCCLVLVINGVLITMAPFCASRTAFLAFGILFGLSAGTPWPYSYCTWDI